SLILDSGISQVATPPSPSSLAEPERRVRPGIFLVFLAFYLFPTHTAAFLSPLFTVAFSIPPLKTLAVH
ncbi:MAG: hypothetical protein J6W11_05305, partial [Alphaproteobacteria bacterium]|nr:hypothetical protein [Alphaproteobacteria bacterium]